MLKGSPDGALDTVTKVGKGLSCMGIFPEYSIKQYREDFWKIIRFEIPHIPHVPAPRSGRGENDQKFKQSLIRAKSVITQIAICNDWDWFFTCTLNPEIHDNTTYFAFCCKFPQWVRDYNKKYGCKIKYLLVPEQHEKGTWHVHGFLSGIPEDHISEFVPGIHPWKLIHAGFMNWGRCSNAFGFCSLGRVRDPVAAGFYVSKYITADLSKSAVSVGSHLYWCSVGLLRAKPFGYVYDRSLTLDLLIDTEGQYCSTGYTDKLDWVTACELVGIDEIVNFAPVLVDEDTWYEQMNIAGWCSGNMDLSLGSAGGSIPPSASIIGEGWYNA